MVNIKLTKKELEFLDDWLHEDLELALDNEPGNKLLVKQLRSILKRLQAASS